MSSHLEVTKVEPSSFRDPSGFVYFQKQSLLRQVNLQYKENYDHLMGSGLYQTLLDSGLIVAHEEVDIGFAATDEAYRVIRPEFVPFISYPFEWCFSQLKAAALITLKIQNKSLALGMSLKDCSAYNIQFRNGNPIHIDTLSFEKYREGKPWVAYRQFCQHFLAPLALMSFVDVRLNQLLRVYMDGVPLDLARTLLPFRTFTKFSLLSHIHLHAGLQKRLARKSGRTAHGVSRQGLLGLIDSLQSGIKNLNWRPKDTEWANYYEATNYDFEAFQHKKQLVTEFLDQMTPMPRNVWDLGANTGLFSRIASQRGIPTISFDLDPACVERNYLESKQKGETQLLPLLLDLTNPSPNLGWENRERTSWMQRGPADVVMALALVHHLAISNNLPLGKIAEFFSQICQSLIIEFVPKNDSQVKGLLSSRPDIFPEYAQEGFEKEFRRYFLIQRSEKVRNTERTLYWMRKILR